MYSGNNSTVPPIDRKKITERASDIRASITRLEELLSRPREEFFTDWRNASCVAHLFLVAAEAVAAICSHLISRLGHRAPGSYAECFESLQGSDVIPSDLAKKLVPMARIRNELVHRYWRFEGRGIYDLAKESIPVFAGFLDALGNCLRTKGQDVAPAD